MLEKLKVIEQRVFDNAGCEFDLLNNQQTREILIEKMGLPDKCLKNQYLVKILERKTNMYHLNLTESARNGKQYNFSTIV